MPIIESYNSDEGTTQQLPRESSANTRAAKSMREQEDLDLREIIESLGAEKSYEVKVIRKKPLQWGSPPVSIVGTLDTFDEIITEGEIEELYGGGTYSLQVHRPNAKGSMVYFKSVTVKIPGRPQGKGIEDAKPDRDEYDFSPPQEDTTLAARAMESMEKQLEQTRESARSSGTDPVLLQTLMGPLNAQVEATQAALRDLQSRADAKDERIMNLMNKKPETSGAEMLMGRMFDSQSSRADSLRAGHESELRMMRENARDDLKRLDDRHMAELRSRDDSHRREIDNMQRSMDMAANASTLGHKAVNQSLEMENQRLRDDLNLLKSDVTALRAKKEKTLIEQASELHLVGEKLSSLGLGGFSKEEDEPHWTEKLASTMIDNPEVIATVAQSIGMGNNQPAPTPPAQAQGAAQLPPAQQGPTKVEDIPIGQPFQAADGQIYVRVPPDGSVVTYEQALKMKEDMEAQEEAAQEEEKEAAREAEGVPTPPQVKMAVAFAEGAFSNETPPETFAKTARNSVPGNLLDYINKVGVDSFLDDVADLDPKSPLKTQAGRNYMREVAQFLLPAKSG